MIKLSKILLPLLFISISIFAADNPNNWYENQYYKFNIKPEIPNKRLIITIKDSSSPLLIQPDITLKIPFSGDYTNQQLTMFGPSQLPNQNMLTLLNIGAQDNAFLFQDLKFFVNNRKIDNTDIIGFDSFASHTLLSLDDFYENATIPKGGNLLVTHYKDTLHVLQLFATQPLQNQYTIASLYSWKYTDEQWFKEYPNNQDLMPFAAICDYKTEEENCEPLNLIALFKNNQELEKSICYIHCLDDSNWINAMTLTLDQSNNITFNRKSDRLFIQIFPSQGYYYLGRSCTNRYFTALDDDTRKDLSKPRIIQRSIDLESLIKPSATSLSTNPSLLVEKTTSYKKINLGTTPENTKSTHNNIVPNMTVSTKISPPTTPHNTTNQQRNHPSFWKKRLCYSGGISLCVLFFSWLIYKYRLLSLPSFSYNKE